LGARWRGLVGGTRGRPGGASRGALAGLRAALLCALDHDLEGAEAQLQRLAHEDSSQVEVYLALARVFRLRGEVGRAIRVHQNLLLRSDLDDAQRGLALRGLAEDFRMGGFVGRASETYEQVLAKRPKDPAALRALVRLHREARRPEQALALARRLHRVSGSSEATRREESALALELAEHARAEGRADEARSALRRALRLDPASAGAHVLRGELEVERGRSKRALAAWRRALELEPRRGPALFGKLRSAFAALGRAADYERFLRERLRAQPEDRELRLELARLLAGRGESEAALAALRDLLALAPDHLEAEAELAQLLAAEGRAVEACACYASLVGRLARSGALRPGERGFE
jgi:lipopolysaccharide biosynthesis regulator YciM